MVAGTSRGIPAIQASHLLSEALELLAISSTGQAARIAKIGDARRILPRNRCRSDTLTACQRSLRAGPRLSIVSFCCSIFRLNTSDFGLILTLEPSVPSSSVRPLLIRLIIPYEQSRLLDSRSTLPHVAPTLPLQLLRSTATRMMNGLRFCRVLPTLHRTLAATYRTTNSVDGSLPRACNKQQGQIEVRLRNRKKPHLFMLYFHMKSTERVVWWNKPTTSHPQKSLRPLRC